MFGGKTVPWTFNKAIAPFVAFVRFLCVRLWGYFDDFVALDQSQTRLNKIGQKVLKPLLHWLNMMVAESKSCWTPSQSVVKMGFELDLKEGLIKVLEERGSDVALQCQKLAAALCDKTGARPPTRWIASVQGKLMALDQAFAPGRMLLFHTFRLLAKLVADVGWKGKMAEALSADHVVVSDLKFAAKLLLERQHCQRPFLMVEAVVQVEIDSSDEGWGGQLLLLDEAPLLVRGTWTAEERLLHINVKEVKVLTRVVQALGETGAIAKAYLQPTGDSTVAQAVIKKLSSRSAELNAAVRELWQTCLRFDLILISPLWLSTHDNVVPDWLSREESDWNDWRLSDFVFHRLEQIWGPPDIDRFAEMVNSKCRHWNSKFLEPGSLGVNALAQHDYGRYLNYCCPPVALLERLVPILVQQRGEAILICPFWPAAGWWVTLASLGAIVDMVRLEEVAQNGDAYLLVGRSGHLPGGPGRWDWVALRLSFLRNPDLS
jgi:hypothetical protein